MSAEGFPLKYKVSAEQYVLRVNGIFCLRHTVSGGFTNKSQCVVLILCDENESGQSVGKFKCIRK